MIQLKSYAAIFRNSIIVSIIESFTLSKVKGMISKNRKTVSSILDIMIYCSDFRKLITYVFLLLL
jgi:hypothetical protein